MVEACHIDAIDFGGMPGMSDGLCALSDAEAHIRVVTNRFLAHGNHGRDVVDTIAWL